MAGRFRRHISISMSRSTMSMPMPKRQKSLAGRLFHHRWTFRMSDGSALLRIRPVPRLLLLVCRKEEQMAEFTIPKHGEICWRELATSDLEAAKTFYSNLFGWK